MTDAAGSFLIWYLASGLLLFGVGRCVWGPGWFKDGMLGIAMVYVRAWQWARRRSSS
jgi:hypothetical protein